MWYFKTAERLGSKSTQIVKNICKFNLDVGKSLWYGCQRPVALPGGGICPGMEMVLCGAQREGGVTHGTQTEGHGVAEWAERWVGRETGGESAMQSCKAANSTHH